MRTVLLVDDSAVDRRLYGGLLKKESDFRVEYAEDGAAALRKLRRELPDVVVTDLQMPEVDGLQLVQAIANMHPQLPVILLTGVGSEELATAALQKGAAGYVPKAHGRELLVGTVRRVLSLVRSDQINSQLIDCATGIEFSFALLNDPNLIDGVVALAQWMISGVGVCTGNETMQVGMALQQALLNALYHGNLELDAEQWAATQRDHARGAKRVPIHKQLAAKSPYCDRRIHVTLSITPEQACFTVRDEGPGFDVHKMSGVEIPLSAKGGTGRGLYLMWAFMTTVTFNAKGNSVTMVKRRSGLPATQVASAHPAEPVEEESSDFGQLVSKADGSTIPLSKDRVIIGREPSCDVVLQSATVARHHCLLLLFRGWWCVKDLGSRSGLYVDGRLVQQQLLRPGASLRVGDQAFEVAYDPQRLGGSRQPPPGSPFG